MVALEVTTVDAERVGVTVTAFAVRGHRGYLGVRGGSAYELLATVDLAGGDVRWSRIEAGRLAAAPEIAVERILPDPAGRRLYLALPETVAVLDLDDGEPTGAGRSHHGGVPDGGLRALARHPDVDVLYVVGHGAFGVAVHGLDDGEPAGDPRWIPLEGVSAGCCDVAVGADGRRLYLGSGHGGGALWVVDLDPAGVPLPGTLTRHEAGPTVGCLRFRLGERALYLDPDESPRSRPARPLTVWPLGTDDGRPSCAAKQVDELTGWAVALDVDRLLVLRDAVTADAFTGVEVHTGSVLLDVALGPDGLPGAATEVCRLDRRTGDPDRPALIGVDGDVAAVVTVRMDGFLADEVRDWRVRLTPLRATTADGPVTAPLAVVAGDPRRPTISAPVAVGQPSAWHALDGLLRGRTGAQPLEVRVTDPAPLTELSVRVEIAEGDRTVCALTDTVAGNRLAVLVPGYDLAPGPTSDLVTGTPTPGQDRAARVEWCSDVAVGLALAAREAEVPDAHRPRVIPVSARRVVGGQGHRGQLAAYLSAARSLGLNTAVLEDWAGLGPDAIAPMLTRLGFADRVVLRAALPAPFDVDTESFAPPTLADWARATIARAAATAGEPDRIRHVLADAEAGVALGPAVAAVTLHPTWLESFRDHLRDRKVTPADVGAAGWDDVRPLGTPPRTRIVAPHEPTVLLGDDEAEARAALLYRHTARFFAESATGAAVLAHRALRDRLGHNRVRLGVPVSEDWHRIGRQGADVDGPHVGSDCFDVGRAPGLTVWGEAGVDDCAYVGDLLRSAAGHRDDRWGATIRGDARGSLPADAGYPLLALLGRGASMVEVDPFGPIPAAGRYPALARALDLVGRAERHLADADPVAGTVAVLHPAGSRLWGDGRYRDEAVHLHAALTHGGYPVAFLDERDLEDGGLADHTVVYLTGPNLSVRAQRAVLDWVEAGGVVVATPGAATADEVDRPVTLLDPVLGLARRDPTRVVATGDATDEVVFTSVLPVDAPVPVVGPVQRLAVSRATVVAVYSGDGTPAVTAHGYGQGVGFAYGWFPGGQYRLSADTTRDTRPPLGWGVAERAAAVAPAGVAGAYRPVEVSEPLVEACRLDDRNGPGGAVVLLNRSGAPVRGLRVTLPEMAAGRIASALTGPLPCEVDAAGAHTTLDLAAHDILLLDP